MRKSLAIFLLAAAIASLAAPVMADIIPPIGLAPGSEYQLIFVTAGTTNAESTDISTYNAFVMAEAALNPLLPTATWDAVGSTAPYMPVQTHRTLWWTDRTCRFTTRKGSRCRARQACIQTMIC